MHHPFRTFFRPCCLFSALLLTTALHAQTARPGSNNRAATTNTRPRTTGSGGNTSTSTGPRQYRSNTQLGDAVISIDSETRSLVIVTDEDTHREMLNVIKALDRPKPQVLIKVVFLEVTYDKGLDLGLEGSYTFNMKNPTLGSTNTTTTTNNSGITNGTGSGTSTVQTTTGSTAASLGQSVTLQSLYGLSTLTQGTFARVVNDNWTATLHALATKGKVEVLSRPSIMARNNQEAVIVVGSEVPFITASSLTSTGQTNNTIQYNNIGIILRVTPFITNEGTVEMIVAPEISALTEQTVPIGNNTNAPVISKRSAETVVVTPHAQTVVIGGLMETQKTSIIRKIPLLGDIPVLGAVFRHTVQADSKRELLIFLTPYIVSTGEGLEATTADELDRTELVDKSFTQQELDKYLEALPTKPQPEPIRPAASSKRTVVVKASPPVKVVPAKPVLTKPAATKPAANKPVPVKPATR